MNGSVLPTNPAGAHGGQSMHRHIATGYAGAAAGV
jgi:hypothetical protein